MEFNVDDERSWSVLHLGIKKNFKYFDANVLFNGEKNLLSAGHQLISVVLMGSKAQVHLMAIGQSFKANIEFNACVNQSGAELVNSYVSITEISEYAKFLPEEAKLARLNPKLPPQGMSAYCFYPMSKRRGETYNWYTEDFETRDNLMREHGKTGREFAGRVVQLVTGSTGLDDFEFGVTLFAKSFRDIKEVVYKMRFDEASSRYAEFGPFVTGMVATNLNEALDMAGWLS